MLTSKDQIHIQWEYKQVHGKYLTTLSLEKLTNKVEYSYILHFEIGIFNFKG